ncbi:MAG TPA: hypothetical protein VKS01_07860 [Bryobacteraceae bacterium]|nr:hypothetical protein [Bryobacteraceae bacterium]
MDTRRKILDADRAAEIVQSGATVVVGYFDPLIAWHARWLAMFKKPDRPLIVLVADPDRPILPAAARAELVASLRVVDHVAEFAPSLAAIVKDRAIRIESQDRELFADLLKLVRSRNQSAATPVN